MVNCGRWVTVLNKERMRAARLPFPVLCSPQPFVRAPQAYRGDDDRLWSRVLQVRRIAFEGTAAQIDAAAAATRVVTAPSALPHCRAA